MLGQVDYASRVLQDVYRVAAIEGKDTDGPNASPRPSDASVATSSIPITVPPACGSTT